MKSSAVQGQGRRTYRQVARAEAAEATARRIVLAFGDCTKDRWFDEVTLDEVAARAGVTGRTVIRRFGGKEGLIQGYMDYIRPIARAERAAVPGDVDAALAGLLQMYEKVGDEAMHNLAQESRQPALKPLIELGRREHRAITAETYAPWLDPLPDAQRTRVLDALVLATDLYTWKLVRRDMGRSIQETRTIIRGLVDAILADAPRFATSGNDPP